MGEVPEGGGEDVAEKEKQTDEESVKDLESSGWLWHRARRGSVASVRWLVLFSLEGASRQTIGADAGRLGSDVGLCVEGESWAI